MNIRPIRLTIALTLAPLLAHAAEKPPLVVHEWGTFTSLQDEAGECIGGINTEDEPLPRFVHRLASYFLLTEAGYKVTHLSTFKVVTPGHCHPDVTMRLETPVVYFYPSPGQDTPPFDVHVTFRGGWLTEFYPDADVRAPGFDAAHPDRLFAAGSPEESRKSFPKGFGHLRPDTNGDLWWRGVKIGADGAGPETTEKVWLAPRAVPAADLKAACGEREKFLFYRGVGSGAAALRVVRDDAHKTLEIRAAVANSSAATGPGKIAAAWLVEVQANGQCAYRSLGALPAGPQARATLPADFASSDFSDQRLAAMKGEMRQALVDAGLFVPEADALLRTWEVSYFQSPGQRLFYLCPATEVAALLPMEVSTPCALTRVLVGRIELVAPWQRQLLAKIAAGPTFQEHNQGLLSGRQPESLPALPDRAGLADALGRFRNALLLDELQRRPSETLSEFIHAARFDPYSFP